MPKFDEWFKRATEDKPWPIQIRFACELRMLLKFPSCGPLLSDVEGAGKALLTMYGRSRQNDANASRDRACTE